MKGLLKKLITVYLVQILIFLCPVFSISYLLKIFNIHNYGLYVFTINIGVFINIVCDYGFNVSSTQLLAKHIRNKQELWLQFIAITICKIFLFGVITILLLGYLAFSKITFDHKILYVTTVVGSVGMVLIPTWFLQAVKKSDLSLFFLLLVRLLNLLLLFIFVHNSNQILAVVLINVIANLVVGVISSFYMLYWFKELTHKFTILMTKLRYSLLKQYMINNIYASGVNFLSTGFFLINNFCLTNWVGFKEAAIYNVADKILFIIISLQNLGVQVVLPHLIENDREQKTIYRSMFYHGLILAGFSVIFLGFLAEYFILLLAGHKYDHSTPILHLLSLSPLVVFISNFYYTKLLKQQLYLALTCVFILGLSLLILLNYWLLHFMINYKIVAVNFLISQIIIASCFYLLVKYKIDNFG